MSNQNQAIQELTEAFKELTTVFKEWAVENRQLLQEIRSERSFLPEVPGSPTHSPYTEPLPFCEPIWRIPLSGKGPTWTVTDQLYSVDFNGTGTGIKHDPLANDAAMVRDKDGEVTK